MRVKPEAGFLPAGDCDFLGGILSIQLSNQSLLKLALNIDELQMKK